jgi:hypothetical protein
MLLALIRPSAAIAGARQNHQIEAPAKETRLLLAPQARLQMPVQPIWDDSVEAIVTVAVPDSCKNQRHLCRIEANHAVSLATIPRLKWALRHDTLMVLSAVPLQIRAARQSFAGSPSGQPLVLRIHYQHLDRVTRPAGTAVVELLAPGSTTQTKYSAGPATPSSAAGSSGVDFTKSGASLVGIIFVAIVGLLLLLMSVRRWLDVRSQRQRAQKFKMERKSPIDLRPQQAAAVRGRPSTSSDVEDSVEGLEDETKREPATMDESTQTPQVETTALTSPIQSIPAPSSGNGNDIALETILVQLRELKAGLQQVLSGQEEANRRLAEITPGARGSVIEAPIQLALFDILDEAAAADHGERAAAGTAPSSQLRIQLADDNGTDPGLPLAMKLTEIGVNLASSAPVHIQLGSNNGRPDSLAVNLSAPSQLRIRFAGGQDNRETAVAEPLYGHSSHEPDNDNGQNRAGSLPLNHIPEATGNQSPGLLATMTSGEME